MSAWEFDSVKIGDVQIGGARREWAIVKPRPILFRFVVRDADDVRNTRVMLTELMRVDHEEPPPSTA